MRERPTAEDLDRFFQAVHAALAPKQPQEDWVPSMPECVQWLQQRWESLGWGKAAVRIEVVEFTRKAGEKPSDWNCPLLDWYGVWLGATGRTWQTDVTEAITRMHQPETIVWLQSETPSGRPSKAQTAQEVLDGVAAWWRQRGMHGMTDRLRVYQSIWQAFEHSLQLTAHLEAERSGDIAGPRPRARL